MGRCLQTLVLARAGTVNPIFASIEEYLGRNTADYYAVLGEVGGGSWNPLRDTKPWIRFSLTAHFRQATTLLNRSRYYAEVFEASETLAKDRGLDTRVAFALADAAIGYRVRNATYRPNADVSQKTATRDLSDLVEAGLLEKLGKKRGTYYVRSEMLATLMSRIPPPQRVPDPFETLAGEEKSPASGDEINSPGTE